MEGKNSTMLLLEFTELLLLFRRIGEQEILEGSAHALYKSVLEVSAKVMKGRRPRSSRQQRKARHTSLSWTM
jgi:hypothetical protein